MTFTPSSAREVTRARVLKGVDLAGWLTRPREGDAVEFSYDADYLAGAGRPVATTLPLRSKPFRAESGAVPAFFAGLLPEGRRLDALVAAVKTSPDDEFSLLVAVAGDCIGDIRVLPAGREGDTGDTGDTGDAVSAAGGEPVQLPSPPDVCFHDLFARAVTPDQPITDTAVAGVQDKLSSRMISLPVRSASREALLKLTPEGLPFLVENEAFFMQLAGQCGLEVARTEIISDRDGHNALLVERFDRLSTKAGLVRIPQEDSVQMAGRWPAAKYRMSSREVFESVLGSTPARLAAALKLLRLFAFSYLIGNGDLHGKNVSAYAPDPDVWQLTPAYDLLSTLPYGDRRMALQMDGRDDRQRGSTFVEFAGRLGVREPATRRLLAELTDRAQPLLDGAAQIGLSDRKTTDLIHTMRARLADLRVTA